MSASCELSEAEYDTLRSYATGLQYADRMLKKLVDYFSTVEEPTVILSFGDHQPSLGSPGYELMQRIGYVEDNTGPEGILALQSTPYLIPYMTRTLELDRPAFHSYMDTLFETLRGITRKVFLDGEGEPLLTPDETQQQAMDEYLALVYDGLLGNQYANARLYGE